MIACGILDYHYIIKAGNTRRKKRLSLSQESFILWPTTSYCYDPQLAEISIWIWRWWKKRFLWLSLSVGNLADYIWIRPKRGIIKSYISIITAVYVPHSLKGLDFSSFLFYSLQRKSITKQIFKNKILKVFYILKKKEFNWIYKVKKDSGVCLTASLSPAHTHTRLFDCLIWFHFMSFLRLLFFSSSSSSSF